jgi:hypothetical protein
MIPAKCNDEKFCPSIDKDNNPSRVPTKDEITAAFFRPTFFPGSCLSLIKFRIPP